ncbi:hypothetical protein WMY93_031105 [Mugilogobius chulae]|uniref:Uncharacterized protein n=1 Tax=Mugilogobius chulae TaxID=88201 RepID=A0AAW0MH75_9GOBI
MLSLLNQEPCSGLASVTGHGLSLFDDATRSLGSDGLGPVTLDCLMRVEWNGSEFSLVRYQPTEKHKRCAGLKIDPIQQINHFLSTLIRDSVPTEACLHTSLRHRKKHFLLRVTLSAADNTTLSLEPLWTIKGRVQLYSKPRILKVTIDDSRLEFYFLNPDTRLLTRQTAVNAMDNFGALASRALGSSRRGTEYEDVEQKETGQSVYEAHTQNCDGSNIYDVPRKPVRAFLGADQGFPCELALRTEAPKETLLQNRHGDKLYDCWPQTTRPNSAAGHCADKERSEEPPQNFDAANNYDCRHRKRALVYVKGQTYKCHNPRVDSKIGISDENKTTKNTQMSTPQHCDIVAREPGVECLTKVRCAVGGHNEKKACVVAIPQVENHKNQRKTSRPWGGLSFCSVM